MNYRELTQNEIKTVYEKYMTEDFPSAELKPLEAILFAVDNGWYRCFCAYDDNEITGYAFVASCGGGISFLDYFAIVKKYRGTGVGSEFFRQLDSLCQNDIIILEVESVESAQNEEEERIRKRRIAFYERGGSVDTGCMYKVFGVEYNIRLNKAVELNEDVTARLMSAYEYAYAAILRRDDKDYIARIK